MGVQKLAPPTSNLHSRPQPPTFPKTYPCPPLVQLCGSTYRIMTGIQPTSACATTPFLRHGQRAAPSMHTKERRYGLYVPAGYFPCLPPIVPEDNPLPTPREDDTMQRIPSSSTALSAEGEVVTVFTNESTGALTIASIMGRLRLPTVSQEIRGQAQPTEAERIAAQYRKRNCGQSGVFRDTITSERTVLDVGFDSKINQHAPSLITTAPRSSTCTDHQAADATPQLSPIGLDHLNSCLEPPTSGGTESRAPKRRMSRRVSTTHSYVLLMVILC